MGFENSKFASKKFGNSKFSTGSFSEVDASSASGETDIEHNDAWLWESGERILWEDGIDLILLEN